MKKIYDFSIIRELRKREGLNIADLAARSDVSVSVISKLERNQCVAELETIYRLARVFGLTASDMISLAESRTAHRAAATRHVSGGFSFDEVTYGNLKCLRGTAPAGAKVFRPHIHRDDYELCWVIMGRLMFYLPNEKYELKNGESIQFD
ncbi:MAG: helix-turn-helix domain-containing protein, partial [Victivallales bacterium]|nr:helix-turn-helix domain-containing protein [Victivallales bacterium]